jgi:hypothetical protein
VVQRLRASSSALWPKLDTYHLLVLDDCVKPMNGGQVTCRRRRTEQHLADGQAGLGGEMAFDAPAAALGHLMLGEGGEEARGGPALLVGLSGDRCLHRLDAGQAQLGQHQLEPRGIDGDGAAHGVNRRAAGPVASSS